MKMEFLKMNLQSIGLADTEGWWHTIIAKDLNGDGKVDFVLGNHGLNSRFKASVSKPCNHVCE